MYRLVEGCCGEVALDKLGEQLLDLGLVVHGR